MFKKKKEAKKPPKKIPKKKEISFRINPTNYDILSEAEKGAVLRGFVSAISSSEKKVRITIMNQAIRAKVAGKDTQYTEKAVYMTSKSDMGPSFIGTGFRTTRLDSPITFQIDREGISSVEGGGGVWRAYVVHKFPRSINPAWISVLSNAASIVNVDVKPLNPNQAKKMLLAHASTLEAKRGKRHIEEAEDARGVNDMLQRQDTSVYECNITAIIYAKDKKELRANCKKFEKEVRWQQIGVLAISGKQSDIISGWGSKFLFEESSLAAFYPFRSSDLIEADGAGGVYLGQNEMTGTPVIYDYLRRTNYNMVVLGTSGVGKSVSVKTYIDNFYGMMREKYGKTEMMSYVFDLHGEYVRLADHYSMGVVDLTKREPMGIDPFSVMETGDQAVDLLTDVVDMPTNLKSLVISRADSANSISEMVELLKNDNGPDSEDCRQAATYLLQFISGDLAPVFASGKDIGDRAVISMRNAPKSKINAMLISLMLQKIWIAMKKAPIHVPKLLVIEEAWFALSMPSTAEILGEIARSGRKENVHMILMTQDIDEVLQNEYGSAVIKNSNTIFLLRLLESSVRILQKVINLSDTECKEITELGTGQAIMRADTNRIKLKVMPTDEQMNLFNTAAEGLVPTGG